MPITLDNTVSSITTGFSAGKAYTWSHTVTGPNAVIILFADIWQDVGPTGTVSSASYGGVAMTKVENTISVNMNAEIWYLKNPPIGSNVVRVNVSGNTDAVKMATSSFKGVNTVNPLDNHTSVQGTSGNPSLSLTTLSSSDLVVATLSRFSTTAATTNQTSLFNDSVTSTLAAASYQIATAPGSYTDTYTGSAAQDWSMVMASLKPAGDALSSLSMMGVGM